MLLLVMNKLFSHRQGLFGMLVTGIFIWLVLQVPNLPIKRASPNLLWNTNISKNICVYIRPDEDTTILEPTEPCKDPPFLLFVVLSAVNNTKQRDSIRKTWGSWTYNTKEFSNAGSKFNLSMPTIKLLFLLGCDKNWSANVSLELLEEQKSHNDLIVEDFVDSYSNLTIKSLFILKWIDMKCSTASFIMKVDDDVFITVPNVLKVLKDINPSHKIIMGSLICNSKPIHNNHSKWFTPTYMFSEGVYPNYLSGPAYVLSGNVVPLLLSASMNLPFFHLEDVFITGICAKKIGVKPVDNIGFSYQKRPLNPCIFKAIISTHGLISNQMLKMWSLLHSGSHIKKCKPLKKSEIRSYQPRKCVWR